MLFRVAASRTLTRPDPSAMLPGTTFVDPSAQAANQGNPNLTPFKSNNFDAGLEWYTGQEGYLGVVGFQKGESWSRGLPASCVMMVLATSTVFCRSQITR